MELPGKLTINDALYAMDGGTTVLCATDECGVKRSVLLGQHRFPDARTLVPAGRLCFDGDLVPIRSEFESAVLDLLRDADIGHYTSPQAGSGKLSPNAIILGDDIRQALESSPEENLRRYCESIVRFVESDDFLVFQQRVELARDESRYRVYISCNDDNRKHATVKLAALRNLPVIEARRRLEAHTPLADDVSAVDAGNLLVEFRAVGIDLRLERLPGGE